MKKFEYIDVSQLTGEQLANALSFMMLKATNPRKDANWSVDFIEEVKKHWPKVALCLREDNGYLELLSTWDLWFYTNNCEVIEIKLP